MRAEVCRSHNPQVVLSAMQKMYETQTQEVAA
jgi:hypothetical protein